MKRLTDERLSAASGKWRRGDVLILAQESDSRREMTVMIIINNDVELLMPGIYRPGIPNEMQ